MSYITAFSQDVRRPARPDWRLDGEAARFGPTRSGRHWQPTGPGPMWGRGPEPAGVTTYTAGVGGGGI